MTFDPHVRLTLSGTLPDDEIFSCSLSMTIDNAPLGDLQAALAGGITGAQMDDIQADCTSFWSRSGTHICDDARLKRITLASIDENGHYGGVPLERAVDSGGFHTGSGSRWPHQISRKVTLETDGDLGRVKGGFYLPRPANDGWDSTTNLWDVATTQAVRDSVKTFLDDLNNSPGFDILGFKVCVASQGRRQGTIPPTNWEVKRVNVGRRVDVQRRRANKLSEARVADAALA